jgi:hypothetical protein
MLPEDELRAGALRTEERLAGALRTEELLAGALRTEELLAGALLTEELLAGALLTEELLAGALLTVELRDGNADVDDLPDDADPGAVKDPEDPRYDRETDELRDMLLLTVALFWTPDLLLPGDTALLLIPVLVFREVFILLLPVIPPESPLYCLRPVAVVFDEPVCRLL